MEKQTSRGKTSPWPGKARQGTTKQPVFAILCRNGKVWAELIDGVEAKQLPPKILKQVKQGSIICSDTWRGYTGITAKEYVHRLINHSKGQYGDAKRNHINGLEGFWGDLKGKLSAKGGIRKKHLPLYLGEYVWRYNHRTMNFKEQETYLIKTTYQYIGS
jgi:transposase